MHEAREAALCSQFDFGCKESSDLGERSQKSNSELSNMDDVQDVNPSTVQDSKGECDHYPYDANLPLHFTFSFTRTVTEYHRPQRIVPNVIGV